MESNTLDTSFADQLLGIIEHAPSDVATLVHTTQRLHDEVLSTLSELRALGVPIESADGVFSFASSTVHLNDRALALEQKNTHLLRTHIMASSHTWLVNFLSGKRVASYAHKHTLFAHKKDWPVTNAYAVLPEFQTHGVGRQGRTWRSGYAQGALCSVAQFLPFPPQQLMGLSLAVGAEVAERLNKTLHKEERVQLKWPNDIIRLSTNSSNKNGYEKLGGVLVELVPSEDRNGCWVVVGVGLNVGCVPEAIELESSSHTLNRNLGNTPASVQGVSRQNAIGLLLSAVRYVLDHYEALGFLHWRATWQSMHAFDKKNVLIEQACGTLQGTCDGVDERGALLLSTASGQKTLYSGDVRLRPAHMKQD